MSLARHNETSCSRAGPARAQRHAEETPKVYRGAGPAAGCLVVVSRGSQEQAALQTTAGAQVDFVGRHPKIVELLHLAREVAPPAASVLFTGESDSRFSNRHTGGLTALLYAIRSGCYRCAVALVEAGADIQQPNPNSVTPLKSAGRPGLGLAGKAAIPRTRGERAQAPWILRGRLPGDEGVVLDDPLLLEPVPLSTPRECRVPAACHQGIDPIKEPRTLLLVGQVQP